MSVNDENEVSPRPVSPYLVLGGSAIIALVQDLQNFGQPNRALGESRLFLIASVLTMVALTYFAWKYSGYAHRTPVVIVWVALGLADYAVDVIGINPSTSAWDIFIDLAWLLGACLLLRTAPTTE